MKEEEESKKVKMLYHFPNRMVAAFGFDDKQIPELQGEFRSVGEWKRIAIQRGYNITECEFNH